VCTSGSNITSRSANLLRERVGFLTLSTPLQPRPTDEIERLTAETTSKAPGADASAAEAGAAKSAALKTEATTSGTEEGAAVAAAALSVEKAANNGAAGDAAAEINAVEAPQQAYVGPPVAGKARSTLTPDVSVAATTTPTSTAAIAKTAEAVTSPPGATAAVTAGSAAPESVATAGIPRAGAAVNEDAAVSVFDLRGTDLRVKLAGVDANKVRPRSAQFEGPAPTVGQNHYSRPFTAFKSHSRG